jgi:hypothetical protein
MTSLSKREGGLLSPTARMLLRDAATHNDEPCLIQNSRLTKTIIRLSIRVTVRFESHDEASRQDPLLAEDADNSSEMPLLPFS